LYINDGARIHLDPGPGALGSMRALSLDPAATDALLISHCHPDHYVDAEVLVEGMAMGGFKRKGLLAASHSVLEGEEDIGPAISRYHQSMPWESRVVRPGDLLKVRGTEVEVTPTVHGDPTGVGFRLLTEHGIVSYVGDTQLFEGLEEAHKGARVLIINLTRPLASRVPKHLCTEDAATLIGGVRPEMAVLTHFGMKLIHDGVQMQVDHIDRETGVRTVAAEDLMEIHLGKIIRISRKWVGSCIP